MRSSPTEDILCSCRDNLLKKQEAFYLLDLHEIKICAVLFFWVNYRAFPMTSIAPTKKVSFY